MNATHFQMPPPVPPTANVNGPNPAPFFGPSAEEIRRAHLTHENTFKGLGTLYLFGGGLMALGSVFLIFNLVFGEKSVGSLDGESAVESIAIAVGAIILPLIYLPLGRNLRQLKPQAAYPARLVSYLGLFAFPVGTLLHACILYYLFSEKGRFVLSDEYRAIVERTPDVKAKTSLLTWVILAIVLLVFAIIFSLVIFAVVAH